LFFLKRTSKNNFWNILGISKDGFVRVFKDIQAWLFEGFSRISKDVF